MITELCLWIFWAVLLSAGEICSTDSLGELRKSSPLRNEDISNYYQQIRDALKAGDKKCADFILSSINADDSIKLLLLSLMYRNRDVPLYLMRASEIVAQFGWTNVFLAIKTMQPLEFPTHLFTAIEATETKRPIFNDAPELIAIMDQFRYFIDPAKFTGINVGVKVKLELARNRKVSPENLQLHIRQSRVFVSKLLLLNVCVPGLDDSCGPAISELSQLIRTILFILLARSASQGDLIVFGQNLKDPFESIVLPLLRRFIEYPATHI